MVALPFYTRSPFLASTLRCWAGEVGLTLDPYQESMFNGQRSEHNLPVIMIGASQSFIERGVIEKAVKMSAGVIVFTETEDEYLLTTCLQMGANRVIAMPQCTQRIFRALFQSFLPTNRSLYPPYHFQERTQSVILGSSTIRLRKKTFDVAQYLFLHHGSVISKAQLLHDVWGVDLHSRLTRRVEMQISNMRKQLALDGTHGWCIRTQQLCGYGVFQTNRHLSSETRTSQLMTEAALETTI